MMLTYDTAPLIDICNSTTKRYNKSAHPPLSSKITMSTSTSDIGAKHNFYTDDVVPHLDGSPSFLGNSEYLKDFYCSTRGDGHLASQNFLDPNTDREKTFLVFGEVASAERGTKLGAQGNHYQGSGRYNEAVQFFVFSLDSTLIKHYLVHSCQRPVCCERHH